MMGLRKLSIGLSQGLSRGLGGPVPQAEGGDPGINPADISGAYLVAIHDLDTYNTLWDGSGTVPGDGDPIGRRTPQVGDPMIQATSANRPLWRTGGMDCGVGDKWLDLSDGSFNFSGNPLGSSNFGIIYFTLTIPESPPWTAVPLASTLNLGYLAASPGGATYIDFEEFSANTSDVSWSSTSLYRVRLIGAESDFVYYKTPFSSEEIAVPAGGGVTLGFTAENIGMSYEGGTYGAFIRDIVVLPNSTTPEELAGVEQWFRLRGFDISP